MLTDIVDTLNLILFVAFVVWGAYVAYGLLFCIAPAWMMSWLPTPTLRTEFDPLDEYAEIEHAEDAANYLMGGRFQAATSQAYQEFLQMRKKQILETCGIFEVTEPVQKIDWDAVLQEIIDENGD